MGIRDAIAAYELLETGNTEQVAQALTGTDLESVCGLLQQAVIAHLVMTLMRLYDDPTGNSDKITVSRVFRLLAEPDAVKLAANPIDGVTQLEQARSAWELLRLSQAIGALRGYRNYVLAHTILWPSGAPRPFYIHVEEVLAGSIRIVELLAAGTGISRVSLEPDSAKWKHVGAAFWTKVTS